MTRGSRRKNTGPLLVPGPQPDMPPPRRMRRRIDLFSCSILDVDAACMVNPSNSDGLLGGGVSRAIFDACGGDALQAEIEAKLEEELDGVLEMDDCLVTKNLGTRGPSTILHVASVDYRGVRARLTERGIEHTVTSIDRVRRNTIAALRASTYLPAADKPQGLSIAFPLLGSGSGGLAPLASFRAIMHGLGNFFGEEPLAGIGLILFAIPDPVAYALCRAHFEGRTGEPPPPDRA